MFLTIGANNEVGILSCKFSSRRFGNGNARWLCNWFCIAAINAIARARGFKGFNEYGQFRHDGHVPRYASTNEECQDARGTKSNDGRAYEAYELSEDGTMSYDAEPARRTAGIAVKLAWLNLAAG